MALDRTKIIEVLMHLLVCVGAVLFAQFLRANYSLHDSRIYVMVLFMGPFLKSFFYATLERRDVPVDSRHRIGIALGLSTLGFFVGCSAQAIKNPALSFLVVTAALFAAVEGFLPLQKAIRNSQLK